MFVLKLAASQLPPVPMEKEFPDVRIFDSPLGRVAWPFGPQPHPTVWKILGTSSPNSLSPTVQEYVNAYGYRMTGYNVY
ncbi:unnamed protein product, partial [Mesorhabditis spiculigera]